MGNHTRADFDQWCARYLDARPLDEPLFETQHRSHVLGLALDNGRNVVIKARPDEPRITGCTQVQQHLFGAGYPVPQILAGPAPLGDWTATAELYVPGGEFVSHGPDIAFHYAGALAELLRLAPDPTRIGPLDPAPTWVRWDHTEQGVWAPRDDGEEDLNAFALPDWLEDVARRVRARLGLDTSRLVVGHADWDAQNLRFAQDGRLYVVHDWDSAVVRSEAVLVGAAAAVYTASGEPLTEPTIDQTEAFLDAYQHATTRLLAAGDLQACWTAGLWVRAYNAAKAAVDGALGRDDNSRGVLDRLAVEADERLARTGA
jgi:hypothetical protein